MKICLQKTSPKLAFTLLELSIVLVIIGLVAGGVVAGKTIIESFRVNAQGSQFTSYDTASGAFKLEYDALPGDMTASNLTSYGFYTSANNASNDPTNNPGVHNGDGRICNYAGCRASDNATYPGAFLGNFTNTYGEPATFFRHLVDAKLTSENIAFSGTFNVGEEFPIGKIDNLGFTIASDGEGKSHWYFLGIDPVSAGGSSYIYTWNQGTGMAADIAASYDTKFDDGAPYTGDVRATMPFSTWGIYVRGFNNNLSTSDVGNCITGSFGSYTYNAAVPTAKCQLSIKNGNI